MAMTQSEIQNALGGGATVYLPAGQVTLSSTLYLRTGSQLVGEGPATRLVASGDFPCVTIIDTDDTAASDVAIRRLCLSRTNTAGTPGAAQSDSQGVLVCGDRVVLEDLVLEEHYDAVSTAPSPAAASGRVYLSRVSISHSNTGESDASRYGVLATNADRVYLDHVEFLDDAATANTATVGDAELTLGAGDATVTRLFRVSAPAAASTTAVHANYNADQANAFPGAFSDPDFPRNVTVTFDAAWDGGDVTVVGTDALGAAQSEVIADTPGSTVAGAKIFATVTSATKQTVGAAAAPASIGTGTILGVAADVADAFGVLHVGGAAEAVTVSATNNSFAPTSAPNGARVYVVALNVRSS